MHDTSAQRIIRALNDADVSVTRDRRGPVMLNPTAMRLDGRVAIVTGAGRGLGRSYAHCLAHLGAQVVVNDVGTSMLGEGRGDDVAATVVAEIISCGGTAVADMHDISQSDGALALVEQAIARFGRIDIVVNNAGIIRRAPILEVTPESLEQVLRVNLIGTLYVTQAVWPRLVAQRYGRVVNATSATGLLGNVGSISYAASKAGIIGLTRVLALEGEPHGIRVNAVAPLAHTRMTASLAEANTLLARLDPEQVAPVVAWLAHEDCQVSGEVYSAGGGRVARYFTGLTKGYFNDALTPDDVHQHVESIRSTRDYTVPTSPDDEFAVLARQASPSSTPT